MVGDTANRSVGLAPIIGLQTSVVAGMRAALRMRTALFGAIVITFALALSTVRAATITVGSLADDVGASPNTANLLVNGDFSLGNTGFTSDYIFTSDILPAGTYCIDTDPHHCHPLAASYGDHTSGTGLMLIANGDVTPNQVV
jgi:hypothetical protein